MTRRLGLALLVLVCAITTTGLLSCSNTSGTGPIEQGPVLTIADSVFDFGSVPQHSTVTHVFWLHSTGTETVVVDRITSDCTCIKPALSTASIAPGDSVALTIEFQSKTYLGRIDKRPAIYSNADGLETARRVSVVSYVTAFPDSVRPVTIDPYKGMMLRIDSSHDTDSVPLTLTNHTGKELDVQIVDFPSEYITAELPSQIGANGEESGVIRLNYDAEVSFTTSLTLQFGPSAEDRMTYPVVRNVLP
jgi:hypothetical protein